MGSHRRTRDELLAQGRSGAQRPAGGQEPQLNTSLALQRPSQFGPGAPGGSARAQPARSDGPSAPRHPAPPGPPHLVRMHSAHRRAPCQRALRPRLRHRTAPTACRRCITQRGLHSPTRARSLPARRLHVPRPPQAPEPAIDCGRLSSSSQEGVRSSRFLAGNCSRRSISLRSLLPSKLRFVTPVTNLNKLCAR